MRPVASVSADDRCAARSAAPTPSPLRRALLQLRIFLAVSAGFPDAPAVSSVLWPESVAAEVLVFVLLGPWLLNLLGEVAH